MPVRKGRRFTNTYMSKPIHAKSSNRELLTGGDWNAALYSCDLQTGELIDMDKMQSMRMRPVNFDCHRAHTFYGHGDAPHSSRIDDLFTLRTKRWPNISPTKLDTGTTCDHAALFYKIPTHNCACRYHKPREIRAAQLASRSSRLTICSNTKPKYNHNS